MVLKHAFVSHLTLFILDTGTRVLPQILNNKMIKRHFIKSKPQGYKSFFMLNSTEHEISTAHKNQNTDK